MTPGAATPFLPSARACLLACVLALACLVAVSGQTAQGAMKSERISKNLCKTTGGGKFVRAKGTGGIKIDRRLVPDIRWMKRKFNLAFGDGFAMSGHAMNGEHPIGLAADIFPGGRSWNKVDQLAELAEPRQNRPKLPWRWVGYNGDAGHGRGDHLHLSWGHNDNTTPGEPARWVLTRSCPGGGGGGGGGDGDGGGISTRSAALSGLAPAVPEPHEHAEPIRPY